MAPFTSHLANRPVFGGFDQTGLRLVQSEVLDSRVVAIEYEIAR